jgi:deazaflavin-dependent oxidoreductase (nitroreductase family)
MSVTDDRYVAPGWFTRTVFNRFVAFLTRHGLSIAGSRVLIIKGRTTGLPRENVINLLTVDGDRYLVAPRGHTAWVRNLRVAGTAQLRLGRTVEDVTSTELPDADKLPILRAYLAKWGWEVGAFFEDLKKDSDDATVASVAPGFPVFKLATVGA